MSYVSEAQQLQADTEMKLTALYNRYSDLTALNSALLYERGEFYYQFNRPYRIPCRSKAAVRITAHKEQQRIVARFLESRAGERLLRRVGIHKCILPYLSAKRANAGLDASLLGSTIITWQTALSLSYASYNSFRKCSVGSPPGCKNAISAAFPAHKDASGSACPCLSYTIASHSAVCPSSSLSSALGRTSVKPSRSPSANSNLLATYC